MGGFSNLRLISLFYGLRPSISAYQDYYRATTKQEIELELALSFIHNGKSSGYRVRSVVVVGVAYGEGDRER